MLLKHSGILVYVLLDTKITKIGLISADICLLASNMTQTEDRAGFPIYNSIFSNETSDANFLDFAKN